MAEVKAEGNRTSIESWENCLCAERYAWQVSNPTDVRLLKTYSSSSTASMPSGQLIFVDTVAAQLGLAISDCTILELSET